MESTSSVPGRRYADVDEFCRAVRRRHFGRRVRTALVVLAAMLLVAAVFILFLDKYFILSLLLAVACLFVVVDIIVDKVYNRP